MPVKWKQSFVVPVHKGGSHNDVRNYRPISKLSIISKLLDSLMADLLFGRFRNVISDQQHGFFKGRSTTTNLIGYTDRLQRCINSGGQIDVIFADFSKAFDKVSHSILLSKLEGLGMGGTLLSWFESYLIGRTQRVQLGDSLSSIVEVTSSVVQGSHCGPILFSIFLNDIADIIGIDFNCYADDLKIFLEINSSSDATSLQENIDRISLFSRANGLVLNIDKCYVVSFTRRTKRFTHFDYSIDGEILTRKDVIRDLGVMFDAKCSFTTHIDEVCRKAKRSLGFVIRNTKEFRQPLTIKTLYCSLVRSSLEYASPIWSPTTITHIRTIERVQHKFLRYMARKFHSDSSRHIDYAKYEGKFRLQSLELRRIIADVKFTIKSFTNVIDSSSFLHDFAIHVPPRALRSQDVFQPPSKDSTALSRIMTNFNTYCNDFDNLITTGRLTIICRSIEEQFNSHQKN
jgi:hypothetical protein